MKYLLITVLLILTGLESCVESSKDSLRSRSNEVTETDMKYSYLALGDSYTIGESVNENMRWPVQLVEKLRIDNIQIDDPLIVAKTGWTSDELIKGISDSGIEGNFDLVSLLIGVNNQYRGWSSETFREEFKHLADLAIKFGNGEKDRVFVLTIPDWGVMPFAEGRDRAKIASEIDLFNSIVKEECEVAGIICVDITPISRDASQNNTLVAGDGLHPSAAMYSLWVDAVYNYTLNILRKNR